MDTGLQQLFHSNFCHTAPSWFFLPSRLFATAPNLGTAITIGEGVY
jgi:hypothetical protein